MSDFEIVKLNNENTEILVVMKTDDSPFEILNEIQEQLREVNVAGKILIDELLHSGNTEERFISGYFDGLLFDNETFCFENIARRDGVRNYICEYLRSDIDLLAYSCLTEKQQKLILSGCII